MRPPRHVLCCPVSVATANPAPVARFSPRALRRLPALLALLLAPAAVRAAGALLSAAPQPGDFPLVRGGAAAPIIFSAGDARVVDLAAHDLAADIERVTGQKPVVRTDTRDLRGPAVWVGTLGKNPAIDALVDAGKLDVTALRGAWESFLIATVADPAPGVPSALVIAGSDRRGTAFGVYELSQGIGVSPWYWWADVAPARKSALAIAAGTRRFGPPSVKYRGLFINDEDWGLHVWAAKTFEPEHGGIGPKTYAKIFELLLRLKANTLWPAMHAVTKPFNSFPEDAPLADDYAIVMGPSHAEPMLRNNVGEWPHDRDADYNYLTNRDGVLKYWEERVAANGRYENFYTLGMRGIHDSAMQGPKTNPERIATLEKIFADQRALLAHHVRPDIEHVPQLFCAYKEVLPLYRGGLRVPDDVTVMFPDDNFGYIRDYPAAAERNRAGGFGVYYHLSYLGAPMSYLWLSTTPPALVWEEMTKAYDAGAQTVWIANVGDLKPAEIDTEFFFQIAWDVHRWRRDNLENFLPEWAAREFGAEHAREIGGIMAEYYRLNFQRKPEHLQWWLPKETPRASNLTAEETAERLQEFRALELRAEKVSEFISPNRRDAFFELVNYPVVGSTLANERMFLAELSENERTHDDPNYSKAALSAVGADRSLVRMTGFFNDRVAQGKWRELIALEPADNQWSSMRISKWKEPHWEIRDQSPTEAIDQKPPAAAEDKALPVAHPTSHAPGGFISLEAEHFSRKTDRAGAAWEIVPGLGRTGEGSVAIFPLTAAGVAPEKIATDAPRLDYDVHFAAASELPVTVYLVPTHPLTGGALRFALALDDAPPQLVALEFKDGGAEWAQGVLNATRTVGVTLHVPSPGAHTLRVFGVDAGVVLDKIVIDCGGLLPSYLGPPETRSNTN